MTNSLATELDRYVMEKDGSYVVDAFLGLEGGECPAARLVEGPDDVDPGVTLTADDDTWKQLMAGEIGVLDGMMPGQLEIDGDMQESTQYSQAAVRLTEIDAEIDANFAHGIFTDG